MRAIRAASAALLGVASLGLSAPLAAAAGTQETPPLFTVTPSNVQPGGRVTLSAGGCGTTATASSGVFDPVTISPGGSATATVDFDARPGAQYSVQFDCRGQAAGSFNITIAGGRSTPTISSTVTATPRGVQGGLGGSVGSMNTTEIAVGAGMVLATASAAVFLVRRRADGRRH